MYKREESKSRDSSAEHSFATSKTKQTKKNSSRSVRSSQPLARVIRQKSFAADDFLSEDVAIAVRQSDTYRQRMEQQPELLVQEPSSDDISTPDTSPIGFSMMAPRSANILTLQPVSANYQLNKREKSNRMQRYLSQEQMLTQVSPSQMAVLPAIKDQQLYQSRTGSQRHLMVDQGSESHGIGLSSSETAQFGQRRSESVQMSQGSTELLMRKPFASSLLKPKSDMPIVSDNDSEESDEPEQLIEGGKHSNPNVIKSLSHPPDQVILSIAELSSLLTSSADAQPVLELQGQRFTLAPEVINAIVQAGKEQTGNQNAVPAKDQEVKSQVQPNQHNSDQDGPHEGEKLFQLKDNDSSSPIQIDLSEATQRIDERSKSTRSLKSTKLVGMANSLKLGANRCNSTPSNLVSDQKQDTFGNMNTISKMDEPFFNASSCNEYDHLQLALLNSKKSASSAEANFMPPVQKTSGISVKQLVSDQSSPERQSDKSEAQENDESEDLIKAFMAQVPEELKQDIQRINSNEKPTDEVKEDPKDVTQEDSDTDSMDSVTRAFFSQAEPIKEEKVTAPQPDQVEVEGKGSKSFQITVMKVEQPILLPQVPGRAPVNPHLALKQEKQPYLNLPKLPPRPPVNPHLAATQKTKVAADVDKHSENLNSEKSKEQSSFDIHSQQLENSENDNLTEKMNGISLDSSTKQVGFTFIDDVQSLAKTSVNSIMKKSVSSLPGLSCLKKRSSFKNNKQSVSDNASDTYDSPNSAKSNFFPQPQSILKVEQMQCQKNLQRSKSEVTTIYNDKRMQLNGKSPPKLVFNQESDLHAIKEESEFKSSEAYSMSKDSSDPSDSSSSSASNGEFNNEMKKEESSQSKKQRNNCSSESLDEVLQGAFRSGHLRRQSIMLTYVDKQKSSYSSPSNKAELPLDSLESFVARQASSLGLDPEIFLNSQQSKKSQDVLQEPIRLGSGGVGIQQIPEVIEINSILNKAKSQSADRTEKFIRFSSSESSPGLIDKTFLEFSFQNESSHLNLPASQGRSKSSSSKEYTNNILQTVLKENQILQDSMVKQNLQVSILQYYLKAQKLDEERRIEAFNSAVKVLSSHETKLREISQRTYSEAYKLHFAFLYASPLVISGKRTHQQIEKVIYKLMPPLNFQKEYFKIKESVEQAQVCFRITKRQCTTNSLNEILAKNPMGIHFSGHGLLNSEKELGPELYKMYEGEGNFLLLETEDGGGKLVSTKNLKQMIKKNYRNSHEGLQLVVVATCHSEFVGQIFQEAGVQHVVCIHQQYEVEDDAIITFTDSFYGLLFDQKKICDAFEQAKLQVALAHSEHQASIFKLLKYEDAWAYKKFKSQQSEESKKVNKAMSKGKSRLYIKALSGSLDKPGNIKKDTSCNAYGQHQCGFFGPFQKGEISYGEHVTVTLRSMSPHQPTLIGRAKDQFKIIQHIVNKKASRLINLTGMPGVGKSSLILSSLQWMEERSLLRGGIIYQNARDINCCAVLTRKLCNKLVSENQKLFQSIAPLIIDNKNPMKALKLIMTKLIRIEGDLLFVIDNAEDMIQKDKTNFRKLVSYFLQLIPSMKVLLTSRVLLYYANAEFNEENICIQGLKDEQAAGLFLKNTRVIEQDEKNRLLDTKPDYERFPMERFQEKPYRLHEHHLFRLLQGNPQSIILTAPVLSDPERCIDLPKLYITMTSDKIQHLLRDVEVENRMLGSLRMSAQVSIQHLIDTNSESLDLFFVLGMLPGGVSESQLEYLWHRITHSARQNNIQSGEHTVNSAGISDNQTMLQEDNSVKAAKQNDSLKRALKELSRSQIIQTEVSKSPDSSGESLIVMPEYIRNFSEGLIEEDQYTSLNTVLTLWLESLAYRKYQAKSNPEYQQNSTTTSQQDNAFQTADQERFDKNMSAFIDRQIHDNQENQVEGEGESANENEDLDDDKSVMTVALEDEDRAFDDYSDDEEEQEEEVDNPFLRDLLDKETQQRKMPTRARVSIAKRSPMRKMSKKVSRKSIKVMKESDHWHELHEAADMVAKHRPEQRSNSQDLNHTFNFGQLEATTNEQRAKFNWKKMFDKSMMQDEDDKDQALGNMNTIGGMHLVEESEGSEQDSPNKVDYETLSPKRSKQTKNVKSSQSTNDLRQKLQDGVLVKYKNIFDDMNVNMMRFQRGSIKVTTGLSSNNVTSVSSPNRKDSLLQLKPETSKESLTSAERAILYHLATKIMSEDQRVVQMIIKKSIIHLHKSTKVFRGNVRRLQALCLMLELNQKRSGPQDSQNQGKLAINSQKELEIEDALDRAKMSFQKDSCEWGLGLTSLQEAIFYASQLRNLKDQQDNQTKQKHTSQELRNKMSFSRSKSSEMSMQIEQSRVKEELLHLKSNFDNAIEIAVSELQKVNHWKALNQAYKVLADVSQETQQFAAKYNQSSMLSKVSRQSCETITFQDSMMGSNDEAEQIREYRQKQAEYAAMYRISCQDNSNQGQKNPRSYPQQLDVCIMTEIVLDASNKKHFNVQSVHTSPGSQTKKMRLAQHTSFLRPSLNEGLSFAQATQAVYQKSARDFFVAPPLNSPPTMSKDSFDGGQIQPLSEQSSKQEMSQSFDSESQFKNDDQDIDLRKEQIQTNNEHSQQ